MASISSSPTRAPTMAAATGARGPAPAAPWSGRKRRGPPVDPEETGSSVPSAPYPHCGPPGGGAKRARTIDDVLGSLTLGASDPPGNFFGCNKRKGGGDGDGGAEAEDDGPSAKVARSSADGGRRRDPEGRRGAPRLHGATSESSNSSASRARQHHVRACHEEVDAKAAPGNDIDIDGSDAGRGDDGGIDEPMAVEDVDHESDSSVSEGSVRSAMYQLVFGRRRDPPLPPGACGAGGGGCGRGRYDAVDSKIEDIIRRSRLAAVIRSRKEEERGKGEGDAAADMDTDDGEDAPDGDDEEWNPGHG